MTNRKEYIKEWRKKKLLEDPTYRKREHRKYRLAHLSELKLKSKIRRVKPEYQKYSKAYNKERLKNIRYQVLSHYSGSEQPFCKQCGFNDMRALQLDHINNNGAEDKRRFGNNLVLGKYLIENNYPEGYQVLCANCNTIKEMDRR